MGGDFGLTPAFIRLLEPEECLLQVAQAEFHPAHAVLDGAVSGIDCEGAGN